MPATLTEIERRILDYMVSYLRMNTYQPSIREIGEQFGIKSTKTVSEHLQTLAEKGYLERDPSRSRGVRILGVDLNPDTLSIPCYRELPAERDSVRSEKVEMYLSLDRRLAGSKGSYFFWARGDSLAALGVEDGDFLLVEPWSDGDLAGDGLGVHRIEGGSYFGRRTSEGGLLVQSGRAGEAPSVLSDPTEARVVGRVVALYRRTDGLPVVVSQTAH
jgi:repressor LexA